MAAADSASIRNLGGQDPNCNEYNADNSCKKCSYRYFCSSNTRLCTQVSDFCETWSEANGDCITCYTSYGSPVNGKCDKAPVNN